VTEPLHLLCRALKIGALVALLVLPVGARAEDAAHAPQTGAAEQPAADEPSPQAKSNDGEIAADRSTPVLLYCRSGRMSADAAHPLLEAGYTHVLDVDGGMVEWESAGLPVVTQ